MTEENDKLLAVFEEKLQVHLSLFGKQKRKIEELTLQINTEKDARLQAEQKIQSLNAKYSDLLTAHIVSLEEGDMKNARMRLVKLVREVEKCIALLNG